MYMKKIGILLLILAFVSVGHTQNKTNTIFDDVEFEIESLNSVNTIGSDISPALVGRELFFAAIREEYFNKKVREMKNMAFYDTYSIPLDENGMIFSERKLVSGFGEKYHEGPVAFCEATGELYTTLSNTINPDTTRKMFPVENIRLRLVIKKKINGQWKNTEELPFNNEKFHFAHPAITVTGDTLVFSSDMDAVSFGKSDLFMSVRNNGKWSLPVNLGKMINTNGNEMFPTFLPGGLLSFASDGHAGSSGGLDIWYTTFPISGEVINAGNKINSSFDDFGLVINSNKKVGYFSSNRPGEGSDDLYSLMIKKFHKIFKGKVVDDHTNMPIVNSNVELFDCNGKVIATTLSDNQGDFQFDVIKNNCPLIEASKETYEKESRDISELNYAELRLKKGNIYLTIEVIDKESGLIIPNSLVDITKGNYNKDELDDNNGIIRMKLYESTDYVFYSTAEGYFESTVNYTSKDKIAGEYSLQIELEKLSGGKQFVLDDLYYDLDKYNIRPDAAIVLDRLVKILAENSEIRIELGSHTDSRASFNYNIKLSQNRSESVVNYLVNKGISRDRLVAKGYGESQLVNKCADGVQCTEDDHQVNRRTIVTILNPEIKKQRRGNRDVYYF